MQTYILISTKDIIKQDLFNSKININTLQNFILYKVSNRILENIIHKSNNIILSNAELVKFNIFNYKLDKKQIIIPIFNIIYNNLILYLEQYKKQKNKI